MKKLSLTLILSTFLILCPSTTVRAEGDWIPNPTGQVIANAYFYRNEYFTEPPSTPGETYYYNGKRYVVGQSVPSTQPVQVQPVQPVQPVCPVQPQPVQQVVKPYFYDNEWHTNAPTSGSKQYWYNGAWYTTAPSQPTPVQSTQRPSAYVDNTANAKAQELVNYAVSNGVIGSYSDTTDSTTVAQKCVSFCGSRGSFDMTLTTHVGSDGNYVTKYWRAGIERSLAEIQGMILGCK